MKREKSAESSASEGKAVMLILVVFLVWCPSYLVYVRPMFNSWIAGYVSSYPAMLHLIPILGPVIGIGMLMVRAFPPKSK
jgi:hypothetical protein